MTEPVVSELELNPGQLDAVSDTTSDVLVLEGGWRAGKTFALGCLAIDRARRNWPVPIVFGAPTWPMVSQVFVETIAEVCGLMGIKHHWNQAQKTITLYKHRPCRVICRSLDNPRSGEGLTSSTAIIDEWELCNPQAIKTIKARITKGASTQLILGGTTEGFGPAYDLILKKPSATTRVIRMPTMQNAHNLRGDYIESMREVLDEQEQAEKLGGVRQARGGLVYRRFNRLRNFGRCVVDGDVEVWCDFNVGAQCWYIVEVNHERRSYHVAQECIGYDLDTDQQAGRVTAEAAAYIEGRSRRRVTVDDVRRMRLNAPCDASGRNRSVVGSHAQVLIQHGFRPLYHTRGNPEVEDRVLSVNLALAQGRLTIDEKRCPMLASAIQSQGRDPSGAPAKHRDPRQDLSGPVDAIGYGVFWHSPAFGYRPNAVGSVEADWQDAKRKSQERFAGLDVIR